MIDIADISDIVNNAGMVYPGNAAITSTIDAKELRVDALSLAANQLCLD
jgi:hypothetical protein